MLPASSITSPASSNRSSADPVKPLIISAPFGNYIQPPGATPTLGTFTLARRGGRVRRVIQTVRWYPRIGAWVNRIGLRNPGIDWLVGRVESGKTDVSDKIVSIHGFVDEDWDLLLARLGPLDPMAIELNISCPNVGHVTWPAGLFEHAVSAAGQKTRVIVKLPPVNFMRIFREASAAGIRWFHCCNTLPVPAGGVSGKPLKPVAMQCIGEIREHVADAWPQYTVIGGGGITTNTDIDDYAHLGVRHVAIGTKAFNPWYLVSDAPLRRLAQHAAARLDDSDE